MCKLTDHLAALPKSLLRAAPEFVYRWYGKKGLLPTNPAGFTQPPNQNKGGSPGTVAPVRVLVETRPGPVRNLVNNESLVRQCNEDPGPWECRTYPMGYDFARCGHVRPTCVGEVSVRGLLRARVRGEVGQRHVPMCVRGQVERKHLQARVLGNVRVRGMCRLVFGARWVGGMADTWVNRSENTWVGVSTGKR